MSTDFTPGTTAKGTPCKRCVRMGERCADHELNLSGIDDLRPAPYNPREIDAESFAVLERSLGEFGDISGITWNQRTGHLVTGHQRMRALRDRYGDDLGLVTDNGTAWIDADGERFRVRVVDWPTDKEKAANLVANSPLISGDFTEGARDIVEILQADAPDFVDDFRLDELLDELGMVEPIEVDEDDPSELVDAAEELRDEWGVESGQLWRLGEHRLLCGDATSEADVGRLLAGDEPFIMVTDPPYGVEYDASWRVEAGLNTEKARSGLVKNDDRADWSGAWSLCPSDVVYTWSPPGDHVLVTGGALQSSGFQIRAMIIWRKDRFALSRGAYHYQHEPCWYAVRKGKSARWVGDRSNSTVWDIKRAQVGERGEDAITDHGTQKPVECMARPIRNHEGDVYDPFLGSGTTLIAAEQLGRRCYGIEIDPKYVAVTLQRWADLTGETPQLEGSA